MIWWCCKEMLLRRAGSGFSSNGGAPPAPLHPPVPVGERWAVAFQPSSHLPTTSARTPVNHKSGEDQLLTHWPSIAS